MPADPKEALSMTPLVLASLALAALFFAAWSGIPLWMTLRRPERHPDFSEARAYLRAKAALAKGESVLTVPVAGRAGARRHMTATRAIVPGRQHAGAGLAGRGHPVGARPDTHASA
jgi:hypothetical protein